MEAAETAKSGGPGARSEMPRGMTFVTIRRGSEMSLGIKTERGILDVKKAEAQFKTGAPTTITQVFERGGVPSPRRKREPGALSRTQWRHVTAALVPG